jgi:Uma2 family endonuclease
MTISDDRLTSPKYFEFLRKLASRHYWTAADYDSIPDEMVVEIYDGAVYMVPAPTNDHQSVSADILTALRSAPAVKDRRRVLQDIDVNVLGKIYKPDVVALLARSNVQPTPGDLVQIVVEISSPSENIERTAKKKAYAAQGIPMYIVVDGKPEAHFAEIYQLTGEVYELRTTVQPDERAEFAEPFAFALDMREINS